MPRLVLRVPRLHRAHGLSVAHQHGVHPVAEQPLGELGVLAAGAHVVAERPEHAAVELVPGGQQRGRGGCQADAVALQLLERMPASGHLRQRLLGLAAVGAVHRLALAGFRHQMAGVLGLGGGALGLVAQEPGALDGLIAPALGAGELDLKRWPGAPRPG